jgi:hypothetical protein
MPKTEIDYSNTIIYKITCKNPAITDVYVGHTTNFVQRKHAHKQSCINEKTLNYTCKLYEVIRANGGWTNWQMEIINFFNCADHYAARKKEQEYFISLNATLNSIEPFPKPKMITPNTEENPKKSLFYCKSCNINCNNSNTFYIHNNTNKHQKREKETKMNPLILKNPKKFNCEKCYYNTSYKKDFDKHQLTAKHLKTLAGDKPGDTGDKNIVILKCTICNKKYNSRNGLWKHSKICKGENIIVKDKLPSNNDESINFFTNLVLEVVKNNAELQKQNQEFQKQMMELYKTTNTSINNANNTNHSHNKTFNLQFFLNEQCKDAMNLTDFVDSMTLEFSDLEDVGKLGYVEGISKIMIRKLNELDIYKRPIHCSDAKREIMYVKEHNVWEKEKNSNQHIRKAIKRVTHKNGGLLVPWSLENPNCMNLDHHLNDVYLRMMGQSMGGSGEFVDNENKIMKKIAKAVFIDKL